MFTPPPLVRREGKFRCRQCKGQWSSSSVWVTKTTETPYQGESCENCGTTAKPYSVGFPKATIFNRVPMTTSEKRKGKSHQKRFDWRVQRRRR